MKRALVAHLRGPRAGGAGCRHPQRPSRSIIRTSPAPWRAAWRAESRTPGIVIDGAGIGSAIAANKVRGVRAAMCLNETIARYSREHNGANVHDAWLVAASTAPRRRSASSTRGWAPPMREARYIRRLLKIRRLEERFAKD